MVIPAINTVTMCQENSCNPAPQAECRNELENQMGKHLSIKIGNLPRTFKKSLSGVPPEIAKKAKEITHRIASGTPTGEFEAKRLTINRKVLSFKIGSRYRMLMAETANGIVPWMCCSHEDYNKLYMRISTS